MGHNHIHSASYSLSDSFLITFFACMVILYIIGVRLSNRTYKKWSILRTLSWVVGILFVSLAVVGPVADRAHVDFSMHMLAHLFLGMLGPLLIALSAPMTILLRALSVKSARRCTKMLKNNFFRIVSHPLPASILNIGGLWLLYTTDLYAQMHENLYLYIFIHIHVFLAGYLFTISIIYIDPVAHRTSFLYRSIIFIIALGAHGILSKYIYAHPPQGVPSSQAEIGGMLMYYGGDGIDLFLIIIFCYQWFKSTHKTDASNAVLHS
ncbi:cytochrome c oxidase assembly protein [Bacillus weihaiensis]|uniref:cytochrome c oxidase assembly protein n=1 Tax=Bacillus weihaiensis TaxID=1547283 RepID=UPI00235453E8|nr:cytochrome c oxidase assembly protein [Bacillus weihaiensis]